MSDPSRVELTAPLPNGDATATLRWRVARGGLRGDGDAERSTATHAQLETTNLDGKRAERRLTVEEADAYLAQARAIHERSRAITAGAADRKQADQAARAELGASIDVSCARCAQPREYRGERHLMAFGAPEHAQKIHDLGLTRPSVVTYHEYRCARCGSVELFGPGPLDHPVPGAAPLS